MDDSVLDTVGSPLIRVDSPPGATVAAKLESRNPGGSAKDRPALRMVERAEAEGTLEPGDTLVEPTSGNTGIGIAMVGAAKGYDVTVVMPVSKSEERRRIMAAYGADLELVDGGIDAAKERADELEAEGMVQLRQFENGANPEAHYETTGVEVLDQLDGREPDALVAGVGTGGTISGIGRRLREEFPGMDVVAVEPEDSAVLSGREPETDSFQGMGPGFVSPNLDTDLLDGVLTVGLDEAEVECRRLAREEGILVGQSSGGSNLRARDVAEAFAAGEDPGYRDVAVDGWEPRSDDGVGVAGDDPLVLTVFWDSGERYMSAGLYD
ncbi:PLP-dependent cysteine synthase family protein [Halobaculum roseum]|uniref:PLP-dependent cysteine synthase family protein n=1 Tax=Halobaculum roseum TaxID=2175149 RepID=A0ABD5MLA6_9EURY|nr:PLP-dependent cysteine synthase family protein [Halobaculum roseum]QZY03370.1 PLP-dependent cysteine synthase family protein [Halobaculum roseum]